MDTTAVQSVKLAVAALTGLSKDALHIYVGLLVWPTVLLLLARFTRVFESGHGRVAT